MSVALWVSSSTLLWLRRRCRSILRCATTLRPLPCRRRLLRCRRGLRRTRDLRSGCVRTDAAGRGRGAPAGSSGVRHRADRRCRRGAPELSWVCRLVPLPLTTDVVVDDPGAAGAVRDHQSWSGCDQPQAECLGQLSTGVRQHADTNPLDLLPRCPDEDAGPPPVVSAGGSRPVLRREADRNRPLRRPVESHGEDRRCGRTSLRGVRRVRHPDAGCRSPRRQVPHVCMSDGRSTLTRDRWRCGHGW